MIQPINDLPPHVVGIHAFADVTDIAYKNTLIPLFDEQVMRNGKINFLLVLETDILNFAAGLWCGNVAMGLKYFFKWSKVAIVTDQKKVLGYSHLFKYIIPGKFKRFKLDQIAEGIKWVSGRL
jgi:hypothetical protein